MNNLQNKSAKELVAVITVDEDKCVNCSACIAACPVKYCNNSTGDIVTINKNLCIACGSCIKACTHGARYYIDDFNVFMEDIKEGQPMIAIVTPSIAANFPNQYKNINGWLVSLGVKAVFDESFGAELSVMSYINQINLENPKLIIAQPCPPLITYIQIYKPQLLDFLAPSHSPMTHTILMVKEYFPKFKDYKVIVISPCAAKKREFQETGFGDYNVTILSISDYFSENKIDLAHFSEKDFDNEPAERAVLFSSPGGLSRTIERWMPDIRGKTRQLEGTESIYEYFNSLYEQIKKSHTPLLIDCLNCAFGCNQGPQTIAKNLHVDEVEYYIKQRNVEVQIQHQQQNGREKDASRSNIERILSSYWKDGLYSRTYENLAQNNNINIPTIDERHAIYKTLLMEKEEDILNCMGCGYKSCNAMATAIHNGLSNKNHCQFYLQKNSVISTQEIIKAKISLEKILEFLPFGIILIKQDHTIKDINNAALQMANYDMKEEVIGNLSETIIYADPNEEPIKGRYKQTENKRTLLLTKDNQHIPILKSSLQIKMDGDNILLEGFIDITKIVEAEKNSKELQTILEKKIKERTKELQKSLNNLETTQSSLKEAKKLAEQANKMKSEFLANMSHEIRTPMNAILGFTKVLLEDESNKDKIEHLETISSAGESLLNLINEILDFSKIEADKLDIIEEEFSLRTLFIHFEKMMSVRAQKKGIFFSTNVTEALPEKIIGDRHRINQILINLAGNAIKFTLDGGVIVTCDYKKGKTVIDVQDTGIGIPKDKQKAVFEPFQQADGSTTRKFGGTGLGLAISMKLIKLMGGDITLTSKEGLGSKFSIILPLKIASDSATALEVDKKGKAMMESLQNKTLENSKKTKEKYLSTDKKVSCNNISTREETDVILVAEDQRTNQKLIEAYFKIMKRKCIIAENGKIALEMLRKKNYKILLLDMHMPVMNGMQTIKEIRLDNDLKNIYVIALTADAMKGDAEKYIKAGCDDYLSKPVDKTALEKKIQIAEQSFK